MVAEQGVPAEPAVRKSRAGRDLPAAILVGLGLAATGWVDVDTGAAVDIRRVFIGGQQDAHSRGAP